MNAGHMQGNPTAIDSHKSSKWWVESREGGEIQFIPHLKANLPNSLFQNKMHTKTQPSIEICNAVF